MYGALESWTWEIHFDHHPHTLVVGMLLSGKNWSLLLWYFCPWIPQSLLKVSDTMQMYFAKVRFICNNFPNLKDARYGNFHSFHSLWCSPFVWVWGVAAPGGTERTHGRQQFPLVLLNQHEDGTKQGRRCTHSTCCLVDVWAAFPRV